MNAPKSDTNFKYICGKSENYKHLIDYEFNFGKQQDLYINKAKFHDNKIKTTKFTWYNFLPKMIMIQFSKIANIYFLITGIMQSIPAISSLQPLAIWAPFIIVIGISMLRIVYQDYRKYRQDKKFNEQSLTHVYRQGRFVEIQWQEVIVGDICKVDEEQLVPADLLILSTYNSGKAFVEMSNITGEKYLKTKFTHNKINLNFREEDSLSKLSGTFRLEVTDRKLKRATSLVKIGEIKIEEFYNCTQQNLIQRQCRLKNTKWIIGLVAFTGRNTSIMSQIKYESQKRSSMDRRVNYILIAIFIVQLILCFITALLHGTSSFNEQAHKYLNPKSSTLVGQSFLVFCTYFVLLNTMIPISLMVSMEIVKTSQSYFLQKDKLMYSQLQNKSVTVRNSLNQDLGQIQYIFADKTGTLTKNNMQFKVALIGDMVFGDNKFVDWDQKSFEDLKRVFYGQKNTKLPINFFGYPEDDDEVQMMKTFHPDMQSLIEDYLLALATNHSVTAVKVSELNEQDCILYQGCFPDQVCLVQKTKELGIEFLGTSAENIQISGNQSHITIIRIKVVNDDEEKERSYKIFQKFQFTAERKRSSILIEKSKDDDYLILYVKGADEEINKLRNPYQNITMNREMKKFATSGLRTLLIAMKYVPKRYYKEFMKNYDEENVESQRQKLITQLEKGVFLIGVTAVHDQMQDNVPSTIEDFLKANIKLVVLTGDKKETAVSLLRFCKLKEVDQYPLEKFDCRAQTFKQLKLELEIFQKTLKKIKILVIGSQQINLIYGRGDANDIQKERRQILQQLLANVLALCKIVIGYRLTPRQKANLVNIVRKRLFKRTLAIGDGANDSLMLQEAHIGVGIYGQQGNTAVQSSDYAVPQFRMLWRLIFVHGRWNYIRTAEMIQYFFYKNMVFTLPQLIFAFYCNYSGTSLFDDIYISLYNLMFTSIPLVVRAVFQQDNSYIVKKKQRKVHTSVKKSFSKDLIRQSHYNSHYLPKNYEIDSEIYHQFPHNYSISQSNSLFNWKSFIKWSLEGLLEAIAITIITIYIMSSSNPNHFNASINQSGRSADFWTNSLAIYTTAIIIVNFKLITHTRLWSIFLIISVSIFSIGFYVLYMWISNASLNTPIKNTTIIFFTTGKIYFILIFCVIFLLFLNGVGSLIMGFQAQTFWKSKKDQKQSSQDEILKPSYKKMSLENGNQIYAEKNLQEQKEKRNETPSFLIKEML